MNVRGAKVKLKLFRLPLIVLIAVATLWAEELSVTIDTQDHL